MKALTIFTVLSILFMACNSNGQSKNKMAKDLKLDLTPPKGKAIAAFAAGCFWCTEHVFESVFGVDSAVSGYAGGKTINPTYKKVSQENTGHAETTLVYYDPNKVSYTELVNVFFESQDPTTINQQGPDVGSSYRSILFYSTPQEKAIGIKNINNLNALKIYKKAIVTEVLPLTAFYKAEEEHQNFVKRNPFQPYVENVSNPRFEKFKRSTTTKLKTGAQ